MDDVKFRKKCLNIPKLDTMSVEINELLRKDEDIITNYLERFIYTSDLSSDTEKTIKKIYKKISDDITTRQTTT